MPSWNKQHPRPAASFSTEANLGQTRDECAHVKKDRMHAMQGKREA